MIYQIIKSNILYKIVYYIIYNWIKPCIQHLFSHFLK